MIRRFGGWSEYRAAPARIVEEQIIAWTASLQAEADAYSDNKPS